MKKYNPLADNNNIIDSSATISPNAVLGKNNYFGHGVKVYDNVQIGDNNYFGAYCIIGAKPESREFFKEAKQRVIIGSNNRFYKQVTIDGSTEQETIIGDNCELLKNSHVGHDAVIWNGVSLRCNAVVGGWCVINKGVVIGLNASIHQRVEIPEDVSIGMNSCVTKRQIINKGFIYGGVPVRQLKRI